MNNVTLVTGLWDIGRDSLNDSFSREYSEYWYRFTQLLETIDGPMTIFIHPESVDEVLDIRGDRPSIIIPRTLDYITNNFDFSDGVEEIRQSNWGDHTWVKDSPQKRLKYYNPIVMSKMFLLNDAALINHFNSSHFYWIDAGITNTVQPDLLLDRSFDALSKSSNKMTLLSYPYKHNEVHGMDTNVMEHLGATEDYVCRGGFFGGSKENIAFANGMYYDILKRTIEDHNDMGTEENILTIMAQNDTDNFNIFELDGNGLVYPFFEHLKTIPTPMHAIYITTYNAPKQLEACYNSILRNDYDWVMNNCQIFIIDNSDQFEEEYKDIILSAPGMPLHFRLDNVGICGARQFAAEHFHESEYETYVYFEDDMIIDPECTDHILDASTSILKNNNLDYIKLSYKEVYGDNGTQWAWYNVPDDERADLFPEAPLKPINTYSLNAPKTNVKSLGSFNKIMFAIGDFHYCNWPLIFSKEGNEKVFINTIWDSPYEQTWMSYAYSLQLSGEINTACILSSPILHQRMQVYTGPRLEN